eukprot:NODE_298_length_10484_cov_0.802600.p4 type:complete len:392 gc:universal NODE_298_length_10484_cov_0.802600:10250-9075(-)
MLTVGSDELIFYNEISKLKHKSSDMKVQKLMWSWGTECFLVVLSDYKIYVWNSLNIMDCIQLKIKERVHDFDLTKDDSYIVFSSDDEIMRVYDLKRQKTSGKIYTYNIRHNLVKLSADDVMVAVSGGLYVEILNRTSKEFQKLEFEESVIKIKWSYNSSDIFKMYVMTESNVYMYDLLKQNLVSIYQDDYLKDFCISNAMKIMFISGSNLVKFDCSAGKILASTDCKECNCIYFDDQSCMLYVGYNHGLIKLAASLDTIESIALSKVSFVASKLKITSDFEINSPIELFTPPRVTADSVQNLNDAMELEVTPFQSVKKASNLLTNLEERLQNLTANVDVVKPSQALSAESDVLISIQNLKEEFKSDIVNVHVEMIKQMHQQKAFIFNVERY